MDTSNFWLSLIAALSFFLDLGLRLAEDIFDDAFSALRVITGGVATLPAAVFPLADVPFPICSSFRHGISPFRNEQYRNQEGKAIGKPNCYQKVIICLAVISAPNLCLLRRNFCVAGGDASLVTAVRFSNGQEVLFIDYSGSKYTHFPLEIAAMQKALFRVVENGEFLNRLRNGHLEKSVATGICRA